MVSNKCAIWPDFDATCTPIDDSGSYCIESKRAGGKYEISSEVAKSIEGLEDPEKSSADYLACRSTITGRFSAKSNRRDHRLRQDQKASFRSRTC